MVKLTAEMMLESTKTGSVESIKNLNLWAKNIDDVSAISALANVKVISLSLNSITSLRPFASCASLKELFLRKNNVSDIQELRWLSGLQQLHVLWLAENPVTATPNYRPTVLKFLPGLLKLDSVDVTPEERAQAADSAVQPAPTAPKPALVPVEAAAGTPQRQSPEQSNVVAAVMLLLRELDEPALMRLREHIDQRLTN